MTTSTAAKKDVQKLQRAIVDGLEDVKAQDIQVFDTEHLSALFERVVVASGTSNRQTKALAASVRDAVRDAGFAKPRLEGEVNGEWIIVDCGQAVVHIMQPSFRQYYHLEELWGEKPVRLKLGAVKPVAAESAKLTLTVPKAGETSLRRSNAAKKGVQEAFPSKAQLKKAQAISASAAKVPARKAVGTKASVPTTVSKAPAKKLAPVKRVTKTVVVKAPARTVAQVAAKSATKPIARKATVKKPISRKA